MDRQSMIDAGPGGAMGTAAAPVVIQAGDMGVVSLPPGIVLATAHFGHVGGDLVVTTADGITLIVRDYFVHEPAADLVGFDGSRMSGSFVDSLAGSVAPGVVAQAGPAGIAEPIGDVDNIIGEVFVTRADGTRVTLHEGDPVYAGDVIETGPDGAIGVVLADSTSFSMSQNGRMVLDEMIYDPAAKQGLISLSVVQGLFSLVSGEVARANPDAMTVETPVATIGIRGTQVGIDLSQPGQLGVVLMEEMSGFVGEVVVSNAAGVVVMNQAHQFTFVGGANVTATPAVVISVEQLVQLFRAALTHLPTPSGAANHYDNASELGDVAALLNEFSTAAGTDGLPTTGNVGFIQVVGSGNAPPAAILNQPLTGQPPAGGPDSQQSSGDNSSTESTPFAVPEPPPVIPPGLPPGGAFVDGVWTQIVDGNYDGSDNDFPQHIIGGIADNTILTGSANDIVEGTNGDDTIVGNGSADLLFGGSGDDDVDGGTGDDVIVAGEGDDHVDSGEGDDVVDGGAGNDVLDGGAGDDTYVRRAGDGNDVIVDALGHDQLDLSSVSDVSDVFRSGNNLVFLFVDGSRLTIQDQFAGAGIEAVHDAVSDTVFAVQAGLVGASSNDIVTGSDGNDILSGGIGNDVLSGGGGNDILFGGANSDIMLGGDGDDTFRVIGSDDGFDSIFGGAGNDLILGSAGDDRIGLIGLGAAHSVEVIDGGGGFDTIEGASSNEILDFSATTLIGITEIRGNGGNDVIVGSSGDDVIVGGANNDSLHGGAGNDTFLFSGTGDGHDSIFGDAGSDRILGSAGDDRIGLSGFDAAYSVEIIDGGGGYNTIEGTSSNNTLDFSATTLIDIAEIRGNVGNDAITGSAGDDVIVGGAGHDSLRGGGGNDAFVFSAGDGQDRIYDFQAGDLLRFDGMSAADIDLHQDGDDTIVRFGGNGIQVTLVGVDHETLGYSVTEDAGNNVVTVQYSATV